MRLYNLFILEVRNSEIWKPMTILRIHKFKVWMFWSSLYPSLATPEIWKYEKYHWFHKFDFFKAFVYALDFNYLQNDSVVKHLIGIRRSQARLEETRYWILNRLYQLPIAVRLVALFIVWKSELFLFLSTIRLKEWKLTAWSWAVGIVPYKNYWYEG